MILENEIVHERHEGVPHEKHESFRVAQRGSGEYEEAAPIDDFSR
jgi:hypothetical protein